jgi:hypothetical protein
MTDERNENERQPAEYDDDRLLAFALGLDEDPELLEAAAVDATLAARLEAVRADVDQIGARVSAVVPQPGDRYTDLSDERWSALEEFFDVPPAATPRRRRRWWQVVAPVAAVLVVALIVGIVAVQNGGQLATSDSGSGVARSEAEGGAAQPFGESATKSTGADQTATGKPSLSERFADQLDRFAVVVLARAREVSGALQKFVVLRIFKGTAPRVVELVVDDVPADRGRLHVLMLEPTAPPEPAGADTDTGSPWPFSESPAPGAEPSVPGAESPWPATESPWPDDVLSPEPIPSLAAGGGPGEPLAVSYTYKGEPVMVRELAAGTDPASVDLRIP